MSWRFQLLNRPYGSVTEGPVWHGEAVLFAHIPTSQIMRYHTGTGDISQERGQTNQTNGLAYDAQGRNIVATAGWELGGPGPMSTSSPRQRGFCKPTPRPPYGPPTAV